jgi:hypothetical protein
VLGAGRPDQIAKRQKIVERVVDGARDTRVKHRCMAQTDNRRGWCLTCCDDERCVLGSRRARVVVAEKKKRRPLSNSAQHKKLCRHARARLDATTTLRGRNTTQQISMHTIDNEYD